MGFHPLGPITFLGATWIALNGRVGAGPKMRPSDRVVGAVVGVWLTVWIGRLVTSARGNRVEPQERT